MKYFALFVLFLAVTAKKYVPAEQKNDTLDVLRCLAQKGFPVAYEAYIKITELINEGKYLEIIALLKEYAGVAKEIIETCLSEKILKENWPCFGQCILSNGGQYIPELASLVAAIMAQNWFEVATIVASLLYSGIPVVTMCWSRCP